MITLLPDFYGNFSCIANRCRHSCCKGWEIDVDPDTAALYQELDTPLGEQLRSNIILNEEGASFRLTADERCPFLRRDGLCQLILEAGEGILCDICTNHPRFFVMANGIELGGLGLSCERSVELLLSWGKPLSFFVEGEDRSFSFPQVLELTGTAITPDALNFTPDTSLSLNMEILDGLGKTEPIDNRWTDELNALRDELARSPKKLTSYEGEYPAELFNRLYQYIIYRQLCFSEEHGAERILSYARRSVQYIFCATAFQGELPERIRRWSEQIEYCPENVELLLSL